MGDEALYHEATEGRSGLAHGMAEAEGRARGIYARWGKRALDLLLVIAAAPIVAPVVFLLALLVRRDGGPAFYSQERVGMGGKRFRCWKLRTMVPDAEARLARLLESDPEAAREWRERQKLRRDPRVTRIGAFLRKSSLDELPQLWNVLRGEMSLVGPRPFLPEQEELYPGTAYYALRPGLTGYWQVGDRNDSSFAARAVHDARYAREISLAADVATILRTVGVVLRQTGC
ncbi:Sugar transferase involved in LPS biosynthesis (colanic, teichoic acid) [Oceanicella actignis]|uniref:Sugar transferase involved in LPS biosynthesis (Colanic, teichoic acid) n=1 Tax=Oceanicella actignis TaxID=1189325 RepID=A0A1M7SW26_9RHOB|nr:Sugar transferase involved in LPS biosynthesis (colanic, teichoic acid) [Oceanicella actignis]SHN62618.1 Sugar transferase involved in LPS biosynthesis (colanic, teichoic acid) [Oceanicella actignis]